VDLSIELLMPVDKWGEYAVAIFTYRKELNHRK